MLSIFTHECILKGGFIAEIPINLGKYMSIEGVDTYLIYDTTDPTFNAAFLTSRKQLEIDKLLNKIEDYFTGYGVPFSLITSKNETPNHIVETLRLNNYLPIVELACMIIQNHKMPNFSVPKTGTVIELCHDLNVQVELYSKAYPMPKQEAILMVKTLQDLGYESFVAWINKEPVAIGTLCVFTNTTEKVAYLGGAATLINARGNGVYKAILSKRIERAFELGCQSIAVQANKKTSMQTCIAFGFQEIDTITMHSKNNS